MTTECDPLTLQLTLQLLDEHDRVLRAAVAEEIAQAIENLKETDRIARSRPSYAMAMSARLAREIGRSV